MEIKLNLNGLEATITVKDVAEAAQLLSTLSAKRPASHAGHVMQVAATPLSQSVAKVLTEQSATEIKDLMKKTAQILQGTTTAPLLAALAKSPEGLWDHEWKKHLKDGSLSLAPYLSRLSQACDKAGLPRKAFMVKKTVVDGSKEAYHYRLAPELIEIIKSIPDFETKRSRVIIDE